MFEFILLFLFFYLLHGLGITIGYHRLLSHRSFASNKFVEYFWVSLGYLAFQGPPIWWATMHRAHHRYVDTPLDPHSPRHDLKNAYFGWFQHDSYPSHIDPASQSKDLIKDRIYRFLELGGNWRRAIWMCHTISLALRLVILLAFGWVPALASLCAGLLVLQIPLMLNVVCHIPKLGYKNFQCEDDSVNVWWVAILALGEGWHNNHHVYPGSARSGLRPHEFDLSWQVISFMRRLGLVSRVNDVAKEKVYLKPKNEEPKRSTVKVEPTIDLPAMTRYAHAAAPVAAVVHQAAAIVQGTRT
ncbi:MAG TPA: acyl-CoA desaturase [Oculatellaceae cyanobacterium]